MSQIQAILCALAGYFSWVLVDTAIKLGGQASLTPFIIMAVMGMAAVAGILVTTGIKKNFSVLRPTNPQKQAVICLCGAIIWYVNVIALKHLPLTLFYIAVFTAPITIAVLSSVLKHEVLTPTKIACLIVGFLGVILAIAPRLGTVNGEWIGYIAASISVVAFSCSTVIIRKIAQTDTAESIQLFSALSVGCFGILGLLYQGVSVPNGAALAMIGGAGIINLLGNLFYNKALQHTTSSNVAQLHYTQLISGALLGYLLWHEIPTWNLIAGAVLIIASGLVVAVQAHANENVPSITLAPSTPPRADPP